MGSHSEAAGDLVELSQARHRDAVSPSAETIPVGQTNDMWTR